jgi:hypothetical protein
MSPSTRLLDLLAGWAESERDVLNASGYGLTRRSDRQAERDKWCETVEIEGAQRAGYLSLWSSGELDCQVLRKPTEFLVLNEHRVARSESDVTSMITTFRDVVLYADPRDS